LKSEGIAREFINRVQNLRKDKDFELTDRINIFIENDNPFLADIERNKAYISEEVLANNIVTEAISENFKEIEIDEVKFKIKVEKV